MSNERVEELKQRQSEAAKRIEGPRQTLGTTNDPRVVREMRDLIERATADAVEAVDVRHRIAEREVEG